MSRGPGRIERALAAILNAEPERTFTTKELCERIYRDAAPVAKKHRVALLRAARNVLAREPQWSMGRLDKGGSLLFSAVSGQPSAMSSQQHG